jgi:transmembrane sensor
MTTPQTIAHLMYRHLSGTITEPEAAELDEWVNQSDDHRLLFAEVNDNGKLGENIALIHPDEWNRIDTNISQKIREGITKTEPTPAIIVHRVHFLKTAFFRYAAAILILIGIGTYLYINNQKEKPSVTQINPLPVQNDVAPGGNRATLTLADGSKIVLDSAANGEIAKEDNATITKSGSKIEYSSVSRPPSSVSYNTMSTPRGGQYQLTLPDGSQVWLNAESSITYLTAFSETERERRVTITGEVYFEVAKDKTKPFIVALSPAGGGVREANGNMSPAGGGVREANGGGLEIEVLGTHFNINAYKEEPTINTTLLEGSVRLTSHLSPLTKNAVHTSLILKPGQQGQLSENKLTLAANPDIEQVMAWKNGMFQYERTGIHNIMRQVERWYDVEVIYEEEIGDVDFTGGIARSETVSKLLTMLEKTGAIHFKIEGKKIYVRK